VVNAKPIPVCPLPQTYCTTLTFRFHCPFPNNGGIAIIAASSFFSCNIVVQNKKTPQAIHPSSVLAIFLELPTHTFLFLNDILKDPEE